MPMGAPPRLTAARDHFCVRVQRGQRRVGDGFNFFLGIVVNAQAVGDAVDNKDFLLLVRGRGEEVACVFDGEAFGGVGRIGEGGREPDVVGVGGMEF